MEFKEGFVAGLSAALLAAVVAVVVVPRRAHPFQLFGHYEYDVARRSDLIPVDHFGDVLMRRPAARAFLAMQQAAKQDGLYLVPVSGFRDLAKQKKLFFEDAAVKNQTVRQRAYTCAPPGYSEHHTGFSLDVGDGDHHEAQLELKFKDTAAFQWLQRNAARFHFEMSFPEGNKQRVAYEPWHWRYVGDPASFRTFYYARLVGP